MQVVRIRNDEGSFSAILGEPSRLYTPYVMIDFPVRKRRMANGDVKRCTTQLTLGRTHKDYPLGRAVRHMLRVGRKHGITKSARLFLREATV